MRGAAWASAGLKVMRAADSEPGPKSWWGSLASCVWDPGQAWEASVCVMGGVVGGSVGTRDGWSAAAQFAKGK